MAFWAIFTILSGIPLGFLGRKSLLFQKYTNHGLTLSVWLLLFLLGTELGFDERLMQDLNTLGLQALSITFLSLAGSSIGAYFLGKYVFLDALEPKRPTNSPTKESTGENKKDGAREGKMMVLKDSALVIFFFVGGILLGAFPHFFLDVLNISVSGFRAFLASGAAAICLYILLFLAGMSVGFDLKAFRILRELHAKILYVPIVAMFSSLLLCPFASFMFSDLRVIDTLLVGIGLGYYSLSSTMISLEVSPVLGSVALLSNMIREVFTLIFTSILMKFFGRLAPVMAGGATANDSTLPVIAKYCGERYAIIGLFSGVFLTLIIPLALSFLLSFA